MISPTDEQLARLVRALEAEQHARHSWTSPARLCGLEPIGRDELDLALATGSIPWVRLGEGNPYHLLGAVGPQIERYPVIALVVHGWAFPPDDPASWRGRPSRHPGRRRVRSATVVTVDGRRCSAVRVQHSEETTVSYEGQGLLMDAMLRVWLEPPGERRSPAWCRRDHGDRRDYGDHHDHRDAG
jgi:hypothetical protein